jgi:peptide chain release factor 1
MPEVPKEFHVDERDIRIDTYRASGAGGQHVNKTDSAVRATHVPSGVVAQCQDERDQHKNKTKAIAALKQRLYAIFEEQENSKEKAFKREQIGGGNINERIRTYNFPNNRITDHRLGESKFGMEDMLVTAELLEEFIEELIEQERSAKLKELFGEAK